MRSICISLFGVQVTVEGEGWMVLAINNCDYSIICVKTPITLFKPARKVYLLEVCVHI